MIQLHWPDRRMSPNAREDRRAVAGVRKRYRQSAWAVTLEAGYRSLNFERVHVRVTFHPPDNRRRDLDNMLATIKSGLDGVADAIGVNDADWEITIRRGEKVKDGCVLIELGPPTDQAFVPYRGQIT